MSAKTKIVVLRMKELILTGAFVALGVLIIVLLFLLLMPNKSGPEEPVQENPAESTPSSTDVSGSASGVLYIPGIYTTELVLGGQAVDVEVIVDKDSISSIRLMNPDDAITTMYPLLQPTLDDICSQVFEYQSLDQITYGQENKYTSLVLIQAIQNSLDKALIVNRPDDFQESND